MVIIVGAGASGMMAAHFLSGKGIPVCVLEAQARLGGRIHTTRNATGNPSATDQFTHMVEAGAEFIHGDLPLTLGLLREGNIPLLPSGGKFCRSAGGQWQSGYSRTKGWDRLLETMKSLGEDMPLEAFLNTYFGKDEDTGLRNSARGFAEGYDLADVRIVSTRTLHREWTRDEGEQHRIEGGYGAMIGHLAAAVRERGGKIYTSTSVREISWEKGKVIAQTADGKTFTGEAILVTVPLSVLRSDPSAEKAAITFTPALPDYISAARELGYGPVIKVLLEFEKPFWEEQVPGLGFVTSDQALPTWWTQAPGRSSVLTGWLAGPRAQPYLGRPSPDILTLGLESLGKIFSLAPENLRAQLKAWRVDDWSADPYALGGYSFPVVGEAPHRAVLNTPVKGTVFFGGEALYDGEHSPGTVEAALASGLRAAEAIAGRPR